MKISHAIELQHDLITNIRVFLCPFDRDAIALGIEALKEIKRARVVSLFPDNHQLPGETPEGEED